MIKIFTFCHERVHEIKERKVVMRKATTEYSSGGMEIAGVEALLKCLADRNVLHKLYAVGWTRMPRSPSVFVNILVVIMYCFFMIQVISRKI